MFTKPTYRQQQRPKQGEPALLTFRWHQRPIVHSANGQDLTWKKKKKWSIERMVERSMCSFMKAYRRAVHSLVHYSLLEGCYRRGYPERNLVHFLEDSPWHSRAGSQNLQISQTDTFGNTLGP